METENNKKQTDKKKSASHSGHMWMMVICCALPLLSLLGFGALETDFSLTEILLLAGIGLAVFYVIKGRKHRHQNSEPVVADTEKTASVDELVKGGNQVQQPVSQKIQGDDRTHFSQ